MTSSLDSNSRGVLYIHWGKTTDVLQRSIDSLKKIHPELPHHVIHLPEGSTLLDKAQAVALSPFEETLYLDADTVVLGDLAFGFQKAREFGLACAICENPWARRYPSLRGDMVEYNTGVLFFTVQAKPILDLWKGMVEKLDSSLPYFCGDEKRIMPVNDQAAFALAVEKSRHCPFVLPKNWNFRPRMEHSFFGPVKIWHDYDAVPQALTLWNEEQMKPGAVIRFGTRELFTLG